MTTKKIEELLDAGFYKLGTIPHSMIKLDGDRIMVYRKINKSEYTLHFDGDKRYVRSFKEFER